MRPFMFLFLVGLVFALTGCASQQPSSPVAMATKDSTTPSPYAREPKTFQRKVDVDLGGGIHGSIKRSEVDLADYIALINSLPLRDLDRHPRPLAIPGPGYPPALESQGITGVAEVYFIVDEKGMVQSARVGYASRPEFGQAAVSAVLNWRFEPMTIKGKPTKMAFIQTFPFRLK